MSSADTDPPGDGRPGRHPGGTGLPRRWFLAGGAAVVVGGGAGVGVGLLRSESKPMPVPAPRALRDAIDAEQHLLALAAAALRRDPTLRAELAALTADHTAHLRALRAALTSYDRPAPTPTRTPTTLGSTSSVRAQLRAAERAAAATAAARAERLVGPPATVLASISACESTHVELLS
jgi:hypothetical protein